MQQDTQSTEKRRPKPGRLAENFKDSPEDKLPTGFKCTSCETKHEFGGWVYAHWPDRLKHTCTCGQQHSVCRGVVAAL